MIQLTKIRGLYVQSTKPTVEVGVASAVGVASVLGVVSVVGVASW